MDQLCSFYRFILALVVPMTLVLSPSTASAVGPAPADLLSGNATAPGLQQGALTHRIEFDLPPAPGGMVPEVALVANHLVRDGIVGKGWNLAGLSRLERRSQSEGVPDLGAVPASAGDTDRYFVDGAELLVDGSPFHSSCAVRLENDDNRCFEYDPITNTWAAHRDGWTWVWGDWGLEGSGGGCATEHIAETPTSGCTSGAPSDTTTWLISRIEDPSGNEILFDYVTGSSGGLSNTGVFSSTYAFEHIPAQITYGPGTTSVGQAVWVEFFMDPRPDPRASARSGLLRVLDSRLREIVVSTTSMSGSDAARYQLNYVDDPGEGPCYPGAPAGPPAGYASANNLTLLSRVLQLPGSGTGAPRQLRCMVYDQDATLVELDDQAGSSGQDVTGDIDAIDHQTENITPLVVNFDGDSWPDLAYFHITSDCGNYPDPRTGTGSSQECWIDHVVFENDRTGTPGFNAPTGTSGATGADIQTEFMNGVLSQAFLDDGGVWLIADLNRDGADDIITMAASGGASVHSIDPSLPSPYDQQNPSWVNFSHRDWLLHSQLVDINGDGHLDLLIPPNESNYSASLSVGGTTGGVGAQDSWTWIPNGGSPPYWDENDARALITPADGVGSAAYDELLALEDACKTSGDGGGRPEFLFALATKGPTLTAMDPSSPFGMSTHSGTMLVTDDQNWQVLPLQQFIQANTRWTDVNGDGITDMAIAAHMCWEQVDSADPAGAWGDKVSHPVGDSLSSSGGNVYTYSRVFYGDGTGDGFHDSQLPAGIPNMLEHDRRPENNGEPIHGTNWNFIQYWQDFFNDSGHLGNAYFIGAGWAMLDLDRDGYPDLVQSLQHETYVAGPIEDRLWATAHAGLDAGFDLRDFGGDINADAQLIGGVHANVDRTGAYDSVGDATAVELPWHAFSDTDMSRHFVLPADWNADGFVDFLRIRASASSSTFGSLTSPITFDARIYLNQRTNSRGRLQQIWLPWSAPNTAGIGALTYTYDFVTSKPGSPSMPSPVEVVSSVEGADGLTLYDHRNPGYEDGEFRGFRDVVARHESGRVTLTRFGLTDPVRGQPIYTIEKRSDESIEMVQVNSFYDSNGWYDLAGPRFNPRTRVCDFQFEPADPSGNQYYQGVPLDTAIPLLVEDCMTWSSGGPGLDLTEQDIWEEAGWGDYPGAWLEPAGTVPLTAFQPLDGPGHPPGLTIPSSPPYQPLVDADASHDHLLFIQEWKYNGNQRLAQHGDLKDTTTPDDNLHTVLSWNAWDSWAYGFNVFKEDLALHNGLILRSRQYTNYADFDKPGTITEVKGTSSRTWTRTYFATGELDTVTAPATTNPTTFTWNDCGLLASRTDPEGRKETRTYDTACRLTKREWEGSITDITRDDFGRIAKETTNPGTAAGVITKEFFYDDDITVLDDRAAWGEPKVGVAIPTAGIASFRHLDPWGRPFLERQCSLQTYSANNGGSTADVGSEITCNSGQNTYRARGWAIDGALRYQTDSFGDVENGGSGNYVTATWTYADELGRTRVTRTPSAVETGHTGGFPGVSYVDWVIDQDLDTVTVTDPLLVDCTTAWTTMSVDRDCSGLSRGSTDFNALGLPVTETDPEGNVVQIEYDDFYRVSRRYLQGTIAVLGSGAFQPDWQYVWDAADRLTTYTDPQGNTWDWTYDDLGRPTTATSSAIGINLSTWSYTDFDPVNPTDTPRVTHTDIDGNVTKREYNGAGQIHTVEHPDGLTEAWDYDGGGRQATYTDVDGIEHIYMYDARSLLISEQVKGMSGTTQGTRSFTWQGGTGRLASSTDLTGVTTNYAWTWDGRPVAREHQRPNWGSSVDHLLWEGTYNARGDLIQEDDSGVVTNYVYDDLRRRILAEVGAHSGTYEMHLEWDYDLNDRITQFRRNKNGDPTVYQTSYGYNALGWLDLITHPEMALTTSASATEQFVYDELGNLARYTDEEGRLSEWFYDGLGRVTDEVLPGEGTRSYLYAHNLGNPLTAGTSGTGFSRVDVTEPDGAIWTTWSDFAGRSVLSEYPDGTSTERIYAGSRMLEQRWFDGGTSPSILAREIFGHDELARVDWRWGPVDNATAGGGTGLRGSTPPLPSTNPYLHDYTWDVEGRMLDFDSPNGGTSWTYKDGQLYLETVDGSGEREFEYDPTYPVATKVIHTAAVGGATRSDTRTWHPSMLWLSSQEFDDGADTRKVNWNNWDAFGTARDIRTYDNGVERTGEYLLTDARGRTIQKELYIDTVFASDTEYGWMANDLLTTLDVTLGEHPGMSPSATKSYSLLFDRMANPDQQLERVINYPGGGGSQTVAELPIGNRDPLGRAEQVDLLPGSGAGISRTFDGMGRISTLDVTTPSGKQQDRQYLYDDRGRLEMLNIKTTISGVTNFDDREYFYDEPGWLVGEVQWKNGTVFEEEVYTYDAAGNRTGYDLLDPVGNPLDSITFGYNPGDLLVSRTQNAAPATTYAWDGFGGMTEDGSRDLGFVRLPDGHVREILDLSGGAPGTTMRDITRDSSGLPVRSVDSAGNQRTVIWGNPGGNWPLATIDEDGERMLYVAAEGMLLGRIEEGLLVPVASDALGSLVMVDDNLLDEAGAWGQRTPQDPNAYMGHTFAGMEVLPNTFGIQSAGHRLYDSETGRFASTDPAGLAGGLHRFMYAENQPTGLVDPFGLSAVYTVASTASSGGPQNLDLYTGTNIGALAAGASGRMDPTSGCKALGGHCGAVRADGSDSDGASDGAATGLKGVDDIREWLDDHGSGSGGDSDVGGLGQARNRADAHEDMFNGPEGNDSIQWDLLFEAAAEAYSEGTFEHLGDRVEQVLNLASQAEENGVLKTGMQMAGNALVPTDPRLPNVGGVTCISPITCGVANLASTALDALDVADQTADTAEKIAELDLTDPQDVQKAGEYGGAGAALLVDATVNAVARRGGLKKKGGSGRGRGGGACFVAGTSVLVVAGATPIEAVAVGDRVIAKLVEFDTGGWVEVGAPPVSSAHNEDFTQTPDEQAPDSHTWTATAAWEPSQPLVVPSSTDWVAVLADGGAPDVSRLGDVTPGSKVAFLGQIFATADDDGDGAIEVAWTGDVLGEVVDTFVREAPGVFDAEIEYPNGSRDILTGTPNHPFWVDAVRDYVPLGKLEVGTVLHVQGGGEAILVSKTWRQGDFEVFDFEVEGLHNFYVRGEGSDEAGVLVHNSTATNAATSAGTEGAGGARFIGQPDGTVVDTHSTPAGSYDQPNGGRTDILQREDHGAGLSHTHDPKVNTNPATGETFVNGKQQPGRPVSAADVANIESGVATPTKPKGR